MIGYIRITKEGNKISVFSSSSAGHNKIWSFMGDITFTNACDVIFPIAFAQEFDCDCGGNPFCETCMGNHKVIEPPHFEEDIT